MEMQYILIVIAVLQCVLIGLVLWHKSSSGKNQISEEFLIQLEEESSRRRVEIFSNLRGELSDAIASGGQRTMDSMVKNNDLLVKNFGDLKTNVIERLMESRNSFNKDIFDFKDLLSKDLDEKFEKLNLTVERRLDNINKQVQQNLNEGFKKTNETFTGIIQRLAKIDEAQKKIDSLSTNVISLQDVLTDKKSRGIFGEVQLNNVLASVFGEGNKYFELQYKLSNGKLVDAALKLPEPVGLLCVDSKFPLENFKRMFEGKDDAQKLLARKEFTKNIKKHVDDIASKYIIDNETSDQAIMFLPAEAIFAELHAYHTELIEYSQKKRVWITGPSTLMATLMTVQTVVMNMERSKYMSILHKEINKLGTEFNRYEERWNDLVKHLGTVTKDADKIHVTTGKISKQFQRIMEVEVEGEDIQKLNIDNGVAIN